MSRLNSFLTFWAGVPAEQKSRHEVSATDRWNWSKGIGLKVRLSIFDAGKVRREFSFA
jgi:hypothetical protein